MLSITVSLILISISLIYVYIKYKFNYWNSRGVKGPTPTVPLGNFVQFYMGKRWESLLECYEKFKKEKVFGAYEGIRPILFVNDPELIKRILVKDFNSFQNRRTSEVDNILEYFKEVLFAMEGENWKKLRSTMTPAFSSGKMKDMFPIVNKKAEMLIEFLSKKQKENSKVDMKNAIGRFTVDVIAEAAFAIEAHAFDDENSLFIKNSDLIFDTNPVSSFFSTIVAIFSTQTKYLLYFMINVFPNPWDFFVKVSQDTISARRKEDVNRNDFLKILLQEQKRQQTSFDPMKDYKLTDLTIVSQAMIFLVVGYDTTASTITFTCMHLAKNKDKFNTLRQELLELVDPDGNFDYYSLMEAKYLDACISESLRLNSPLITLERRCAENYKIPELNLTIPKDQMVCVPIWGIHRDPKYWHNPDEFEPERFLPENKHKLIPFTYMPFGMGPRNCIAMRFALMEAKICLAKLVLNFNLNLTEENQQIKIANASMLLKPADNSTLLHLSKDF